MEKADGITKGQFHKLRTDRTFLFAGRGSHSSGFSGGRVGRINLERERVFCCVSFILLSCYDLRSGRKKRRMSFVKKILELLTIVVKSQKVEYNLHIWLILLYQISIAFKRNLSIIYYYLHREAINETDKVTPTIFSQLAT